MKRKLVSRFIGVTLAATLMVSNLPVVLPESVSAATQSASIQLSDADLQTALEEGGDIVNNKTGVSVHDPSIIENVHYVEGGSEYKYYVFGSHMAVAASNDLTNWVQISATENDKNSSLFSKSFEEEFAEIGEWNTAVDNFSISGNMWAPDVVYNPTMEKYCMYLSLNGSKWNSVIVLLTSDKIGGPYSYVGPVVYTGFSSKNAKLDYKKTDLEKVVGSLDELPKRYDVEAYDAQGHNWGEYLPHAIDPAVFYDESGELHFVFGSWSGGIYEFDLDENTGLRDYSVKYTNKTFTSENKNTNEAQNIAEDEYYGVHIAGGYYSSGEGPYVQYIDGKYYLFMSYGEYAPDGNYQMRMFSSESPTGPFVDSNGKSAVYDAFKVNFNATYGECYEGSDWAAEGTTVGSRLMTSYKWDTMAVGEISQGHNSAITVGDKSFVIYHTKYDDGSVNHNLKVHEIYAIDGNLVAAPYEYDCKVQDKASYGVNDVVGDYDLIFSKYSTNLHWSGGADEAHGGTGSLANAKHLECEKPVSATLKADGSVVSEGTVIGSWKMAGNKYATVSINAVCGDKNLVGTYKVILVEQNVAGKVRTCFTGMNASTGISVWGSGCPSSDAYAVAITNKNVAVNVPETTKDDIVLPTEGLSGAEITWKSSNPAVLSPVGHIGNLTENQTVTLTETISKGDYYYQKTYDVLVQLPDATSITLSSNDFLKVVDNPFYKKELDTLYMKYTINWSEAAAKNGWDGLFSFFNSETNGRVSMQTAPFLCYNECAPKEVNKWIDYNSAGNADTNRAAIAEKGKDYTYEVVVSGNGITMKENGVEIPVAQNGAAGTTSADLLKYVSESCDKFSWGVGLAGTSFWNTELCTLSDVVISDEIPTSEVLSDTYTIGKDVAIVEKENPFNGKTANNFTMEYTVKYPEGINGDLYAGLFAFSESAGAGRISVHRMPYICYNECLAVDNVWMDIKSKVECDKAATEYKIKFVVDKEKIVGYINGAEIKEYNISGANSSYESLLAYLTKCDKYSIGCIKDDTSFWGSVDQAELSDVKFVINGVSKIAIPAVSNGQGKDIEAYEITINLPDGVSSTTLKEVGQTLQLSASVSPNNAVDKSVTWSSSRDAVATVDQSGKVTAVANGTAVIRAMAASGVTDKITIVVDAPTTAPGNGGSGSGSVGGSGSSNTSTTKPSTGNTETPSTEEKPSSSAGEPVVETKTEQNAAGNEVEITTTTNKDENGNVTSIVEKSEIKGIAANTTVTVTVEKLADGTTKSATADMVTQAAGQKTSISKEVVAQMKEAAGDADVAITLTATNSAGKELYTVTVDTDLITAGNSLYIYKLDADGNYVMVNSKTYKVGKDGSLALSIKNKSDYVLVSKAEATKIEKEIKNTVKVKKSSQTVKRGKTVKVTMSNSLNMNNVKSITYTSTKNSVAKVSKSGKVTAKKAGSATIKAKVTLKNGSTKTVTMKVKVK